MPPTTTPRTLPERTQILILGAGPAGIEAALAARAGGYECAVLETGAVCDSVRRWGHVKLFSPWKYNRSRRGAAELKAIGVAEPDPEACPTGQELVDNYFDNLARGPLHDAIHTNTRAVCATRRDTLKGDLIGKPERGSRPFRVLWRQSTGTGFVEGLIESVVLIDATGTYSTPTGLASGGIPATGESQAGDLLLRHLPDILGRHKHQFIGRHTLVVGGGHSAATAVRDLCTLITSAPGTQLTWAMRGERSRAAEPVAEDPLPERSALAAEVRALAQNPPAGARILRGAQVETIALGASGEGALRVGVIREGRALELNVDRVLALTGYRPDPALLAELQVHLCYATEGLMNLSASLLSSGASAQDCLQVATGGAKTLESPEPGLFVIGSKSYGRYSQYLLRAGCEQIETLFTEILPAYRGLAGAPRVERARAGS